MIYTIGHRENYLKAIQEHGVIQKLGRRLPDARNDFFPDGYPGGYAFQTYEDAQRGLAEEDKHGTWCIWGLDADWERDTAPAKDGWWHNLIKDADIIPLSHGFICTDSEIDERG